MGNEKKSIFFDLAKIIDINIDESLKNSICFSEQLIISKNGVESKLPVGGMSLNIQNTANGDFVVYMCSKFEVNGRPAGSKISSKIDFGFRTIEEKRTEYILGDHIQSRSLYAGAQKFGLYVNHKTENLENKKTFLQKAVLDLVCEGANLALIRTLVLVKFSGDFELNTLSINGDLCKNFYSCTGPELTLINNIEVQIYRIKRIITENCGMIHENNATFSSSGRLLHLSWPECTYSVEINPLFNLNDLDNEFYERENLGMSWKNDIELFSKFLDEKLTNKLNLESFLQDRTDLKDILSDYIQSLLLNKPEEVLDFTAEYFKRYCKKFQ